MSRPILIAVLLSCISLAWAEEPARFAARDTLAIAGDAEPAAAALLDATGYEPRDFEVTVAPPAEGEPQANAIVRFPSPRPDPTAGPALNTIVLEWYRAHNGDLMPRRAPAVLVLHTLDPRLFVSRGIARAVAQEGVHAFVMHSPGYGLRVYERYRPYGERFFERSAQAVADARRARDAIAALPAVEEGRISIQGTSLGGFQATAAAAMDGGFENNFIFLAGADLYTVLTKGTREARWLRESLLRNGVDDTQLKTLCDPIDPVHTAHRLDPERTWLFSAEADQVVPPASARALAEAIGLKDGHHLWLSGDHYAALLHIRWVSRFIADVVHGRER